VHAAAALIPLIQYLPGAGIFKHKRSRAGGRHQDLTALWCSCTEENNATFRLTRIGLGSYRHREQENDRDEEAQFRREHSVGCSSANLRRLLVTLSLNGFQWGP